MTRALSKLVGDIRRCRLCIENPIGPPLAHDPRPVLRVSATARLAIVGQAPGTRVHASGVPFSDASGLRLRAWMGVSEQEFYDEARIAVLPMGFCFPGQDRAGGDLPPRRECAPHWRPRLFSLLPQLELVLLVGLYAQKWHLGREAGPLAETVRNYERVLARPGSPRFFPLPHPSWRNNAWLTRNSWFDAELVPTLQREVRGLL
ncbi:uracil-DNA glycosylase family protein [Hyphomicrobium sp.]|uniref:uracil-DNA glycosylase family protein n=1 Tax=Hyphomicrobium sp. TaxID=82 RepID=UPI003F6E56CB